jgi:tetratricopeptide (TPR) repeat protein
MPGSTELDPMTDPDGATCVRCGAPLPAYDRAGLCPRCLSSGTQSGQSQDAAVSPSSPQGARRKRWLAPAAAVIGAILLGGLWLGNQWRRKSDAMAHYERGVALAVQGKLDEAIAEYRAAIRLKPDHAEPHYDLGVALAVQGKLDEAIAEYRAAIRIKPNHASAHYFLGKALAGQGKLDEAIAEIRKARDNAPGGSELAQLIEKTLNKLDH